MDFKLEKKFQFLRKITTRRYIYFRVYLLTIENYNTRPKIIYDVYESGTQKAHLMEKYIEANPNKHLNKLEFKKNYIPEAPPYRINETIKAVKDIVELCNNNNNNNNNNNTKLVVFINPMHINTFNSINDVNCEVLFLN